ncbi:unnamed protein product [Rhizoctonia solani]|uniref:ATP-dependent RNA helicase n=1 Tax=Rhizoctonia solani TaxID=456999 RepID=A0A8H3E5A4_9AGAM|nr:unnamed protein product [Rhizoctonia solani]
MRNVPKLKELNYTQWKNIITNSIKKAKLWGYVDGSIEEPSEHDAANLTIYYDEVTAVRNAILGSLESGAQKYIEEALDAKEAWLTLEKKYLTADADADARLIAIEQQLASLRLEEEGDMVEHIAEFCRMRCQLNGTHFAIDDQACISMLYRSLPSSYRQRVLTPEGTEMKDFSALCARLTYISQNPEPEADLGVGEAPTSAEDYTNWGVPEDIKAFELTGDKNPLLKERAAVACRDCLLKDHKAGTVECPQYAWRKELWGSALEESSEPGTLATANRDSQVTKSAKKLIYEFSEPVKVVLNFGEMGLKKDLLKRMREMKITIPSGIQQCAIIPMINGRNVLAQAPKDDGKTTALALSILQAIDTNFPNIQVLVLTPNRQAATELRNTLLHLTRVEGTAPWGKCYLCDDDASIEADLSQLAIKRGDFIVTGTPIRILELIRRKILHTRHLKLLAVDNAEQLLEAGFGDHLIDVQRCLPCLQTIATFTASSPELIRITSDLMVDPLHITVNDNNMLFDARHFFLVLSRATDRLNSILHLRQGLKADKIFVLLPDSKANEVADIARDLRSSIFMTADTPASQCDQNMQYLFAYPSYGPNYDTAIATDSAPLTARAMSQSSIPIVHYYAPSREEYAKHLTYYGGLGQNTTVVTFIVAETDEICVIREIEQYYNIQMVELHWDGRNFI